MTKLKPSPICGAPAVAIGVMPELVVDAFPLPPTLTVVLLLMASQVVKFIPPKNFPTVCASCKWIVCRMLVASVTFVAQKLMVKLKAEALPLQTGVTVVAS